MYKTSRGVDVDYPYAIAANLLNNKDKIDAGAIVEATVKIFRALQDADHEVITLREENKRLKHENEFMLRLMNEENNKNKSEENTKKN